MVKCFGRSVAFDNYYGKKRHKRKHESSRNVRMAEVIDDNLCHPHVSGEFAGAKRKLSTDQEAEKHTGALTGRSGYPSSTVFPRPLKAKKAGGDPHRRGLKEQGGKSKTSSRCEKVDGDNPNPISFL